MMHPDPTRPRFSRRKYELHPNTAQAARSYRLRPFRRIRNLIDHLDTLNHALDASERERVEAVMALRELTREQALAPEMAEAILGWAHWIELDATFDYEAAMRPVLAKLRAIGANDA